MRAGSSAVRAAQTGFLRYYAALLVVRASSRVALYFLLVAAAMTLHLSIMLWLPLAGGRARACSRRRAAAGRDGARSARC